MRGDGTIHVGPLRRGDWRTISLSESDANSLAVGHSDVSTKAVENVIFSADSISLVDEVYEATLLEWRSEIRSKTDDVLKPNLFGQEPQAFDGAVWRKDMDELFAGYGAV